MSAIPKRRHPNRPESEACKYDQHDWCVKARVKGSKIALRCTCGCHAGLLVIVAQKPADPSR